MQHIMDFKKYAPIHFSGQRLLCNLLWLMIPHKQNVNVMHTILKASYNRHLYNMKSLVENAFGIFKKTFG